jgi:hypothetical protein
MKRSPLKFTITTDIRAHSADLEDTSLYPQIILTCYSFELLFTKNPEYDGSSVLELLQDVSGKTEYKADFKFTHTG